MSSPKGLLTIMLLLLAFISMSPSACSPQASSSQVATISPPGHTGFVAPLIHRSSPKSPFYNPHATPDDIVRENRRISASRQRYFSQRIPGRSYTKAPVSHDFIMTYDIGTPRVQMLGIPDTGSELIWLQCQPCELCYEQIIPIFDPRKSSSYKTVLCTSPECLPVPESTCGPEDELCLYDVVYMDGSTSHGKISKETLTVMSSDYSTSTALPDTLFGCGSFNNDTTGEGVPGVVGLQNTSISLVGQLKSSTFSYCQNGGQSGGWIHFGPSALLLGEKTPLVPNKWGNYHLILEGIQVEDEKLNISNEVFQMGDDAWETGFVIDSGTAYTHLHTKAYDVLITKLKEVMKGKEAHQTEQWELCFDTDHYALPYIDFLFKDMPLLLSTENAWVIDNEGKFCLAMDRAFGPVSILGMHQQRWMNVGYDLKENQLWMKYLDHCQDD